MLHHLIIPAKFLSFYEEGQGIRFAIGLYVQTNGGNVYQQADKLFINTPNDVYIYVSGVTDFKQKETLFFKKKLYDGKHPAHSI